MAEAQLPLSGNEVVTEVLSKVEIGEVIHSDHKAAFRQDIATL